MSGLIKVKGEDTHYFVIEQNNAVYGPESVPEGKLDLSRSKTPSMPVSELIGANDETIKSSNRQNIKISGFHVIGGKEDCIDIVRGSDNTISEVELEIDDSVGTKQFLTIKGGVQDVYLKNISISGEPKGWMPISFIAKKLPVLFTPDFVFGDWSDYNCNPRHPQTLVKEIDTIWHKKGRKVRLIFWHASCSDNALTSLIEMKQQGLVDYLFVPEFLVKMRFAAHGLIYKLFNYKLYSKMRNLPLVNI